MKEHHWHIRFVHPNKSAVEEHRFNHNHVVKFQGTRILSIVPGYIARLIRGGGDCLEVHLNNMNREKGWPDVERVMETSYLLHGAESFLRS